MRSFIPIATVFTLLAAVSCGQTPPTAPTDQAQSADLLDVPTSHQGQGVALSVTGSGHYTTSAGNLRTFAFEVKELQDGSVRGSFQLTGHGHPTSTLHGPLTCLAVVGNEAWIGGVYDRASSPVLVGTGFWFYVQDDGEGHNAPPDLVRRHVRSGNADDCASMPDPGTEFLFPVEAGNIQIHSR